MKVIALDEFRAALDRAGCPPRLPLSGRSGRCGSSSPLPSLQGGVPTRWRQHREHAARARRRGAGRVSDVGLRLAALGEVEPRNVRWLLPA